MKQDLKQLSFICIFLMIGCAVGYFFSVSLINQLKDPEFTALLASHNMSVPEPPEVIESVIAFGWLFAGIATGIIFYNSIAQKWLTPVAPRILIGFITFPFHAWVGAIGFLPFIIYKGICLFRKRKEN